MGLDHTSTMGGSTATVRDSTPAVGLPAQGTMLGKYCLQRELGSGGMGVVFAAFDTDLERTVALKLLHPGRSHGGARLLREARTMARLAHRNVVTVFEAGSSGGHDHVVMELVDGESLADWLQGKPPLAARIDAFLHAGRGLVAAHDAGIVHRDFKPHNVLRARDGRIAVTDFGLACDDHDALTTGRAGTPAYMAPEQWTGTATFASDQFAFCVALWEALTGSRPFDDERPAREVPRALRSILLRGLELDPARRWPSMASLLAAIETTQRRRRGVALAVALMTICALVAALLREPTSPPAILARDPALVWSSATSATVAVRSPQAARAVDSVMQRWAIARTFSTSTAEDACLDAVLVRADVIARMLEASTRDNLRATQWMLDPASCQRARPARFALADSADFREVAAVVFAEPSDKLARLEAVIAHTADPCAASAARLETFSARLLSLDAADVAVLSRDAERCDDDDLRAHVAILDAARVMPQMALGGRELETKLLLADAAAERAGGMRVYTASRLHAALSEFQEDRDAMVRWSRKAAASLTGPDFASERVLLEIQLATAAELVALRPRVAGDEYVVLRIDARRAELAFADGDVATAHAELARVQPQLVTREPGEAIAGRVVDPQGRPVAGATVACDHELWGDELGVATGVSPTLRFTTTSVDGTFAIPDAPANAMVIAQHGLLRSKPVSAAAGVTLALAPTRAISGRVELGNARREDYRVQIEIGAYKLIAPIQRDGSYRLVGAPATSVPIRLVSPSPLSLRMDEVAIVAEAGATHANLALPTDHRAVHVIVRSPSIIPHPNAIVIVVPGKIESIVLDDTETQFAQAHGRFAREPGPGLPAEVTHLLRPGDLHAEIAEAPIGLASVCAIGIPKAEQLLRLAQTRQKLTLRCWPLSAKTTTLVVEAPLMPRLD